MKLKTIENKNLWNAIYRGLNTEWKAYILPEQYKVKILIPRFRNLTQVI